MPLSDAESAERASARYAIEIIGGDAVFLCDRHLGHKLYMGLGRPVSRLELRNHIAKLTRDLKHLSAEEFFSKYGLKG